MANRATEIDLFSPSELPAAHGFSHAAAAGEIVWVSGQVASDSNGDLIGAQDMAAQVARTLRNVSIALDEAGCSPSDIVKITYFVTDVEAYRAALPALAGPFRETLGRHRPASTLVEVAALLEPEAMIEIECVALRNRKNGSEGRQQ